MFLHFVFFFVFFRQVKSDEMISHAKGGKISQVSRYEELPEGAVPISPDDVLLFQLERLKNWKNGSEV